DLAGRSAGPGGLAGAGPGRDAPGAARPHRRDVDGHAAAQRPRAARRRSRWHRRMSGARLAAPPVLVTGGAARAWAERVAALTRVAYRGSDPLPGLPTPDGAFETAAAVRAALADGELLWLARDDAGDLRGALRVAARPAATWHVQRVVVDPRARGAGVARELLATVERAAHLRGVQRLRLHAVVERCLPPLYARLGFEVVDHWPADDKGLTELTMQRRPGAPAGGWELPRWRARPTGTVV